MDVGCWMLDLEKLAVVSGMLCRFSTESAERSRVSSELFWRLWRACNLDPLKERVASGESEDPLDSATAGRKRVTGRCVLNWSILVAVLVGFGSAVRTWLVSFRSEVRGASRRDNGRAVGWIQRAYCYNFVTDVTELLQNKTLVKCRTLQRNAVR